MCSATAGTSGRRFLTKDGIRRARSGRYYARKKLDGIRRERSFCTCDRKFAERRMKEWISSLDKVDAKMVSPTGDK